MKAKKIALLIASILTNLTCSAAFAHEIVLNNSAGEKAVIQIQQEENFLSVMEAIAAYLEACPQQGICPSNLGAETAFNMKVWMSAEGIKAKVSPDAPLLRDYNKPLTRQEKQDIYYIVKTLADENVLDIWSHQSALKKAGDRVDHVHPLRFLECIFSDDKLKTSIASLKGKTLVWSDFLKGLKKSLSQEFKNKNITQEFIQDFAKRVEVDPNLLIPPIQAQEWEKLVNILIANVPGTQGDNRYNL